MLMFTTTFPVGFRQATISAFIAKKAKESAYFT